VQPGLVPVEPEPEAPAPAPAVANVCPYLSGYNF